MVKVTKPAPPNFLEMRLFAPGMTLLHRAGLGGLASTLKYIERAWEKGALLEDELPGWPWANAQPPWEIDAQTVMLRFGKPDAASEYLKRLFKIAFDIKDGLIYLPGQYSEVPPTASVRAILQEAIQLTFLQHGPTCGSRTAERTVTYEVDNAQLTITHDVFTSYKHQGWYWLERNERSKEKDPVTGKKLKTGNRIQNHVYFPAVTDGGVLAGGGHPVDNAIFPGAMPRHNRFDRQSSISESDGGLICLYFAPVGCLALVVNKVTGVLIVPEIEDLRLFALIRPHMTPTSPKECRIGNAADAALQAQVRLRGKHLVQDQDLPGCYGMTLKPTAWAGQIKSRVATVRVPSGNELRLDRFELALALLPAKVVTRTAAETKGRGKNKTTVERRESFMVDSIIRPLVAENLALGRPWYAGFVRLMTKLDANNRPLRDKLPFEKRGLHEMTEQAMLWDYDGEAAIVRAVHEAMRNRYGQIADENKGKPVAMKKRFAGEYDRRRLAFAGAKTADQFRNALCDLFSRGRSNSVLQDYWMKVLPMLDTRRWQLARDLALLALASYQGKGAETTAETTVPATASE
jgi:CRISPR-associated protein Cas8a1/Csx13